MKIPKMDVAFFLFHTTENKSLNQQTGPDVVQTMLTPTHSQRPKVDGGMLMSVGQ